jgi:hypothetical protein
MQQRGENNQSQVPGMSTKISKKIFTLSSVVDPTLKLAKSFEVGSLRVMFNSVPGATLLYFTFVVTSNNL